MINGREEAVEQEGVRRYPGLLSTADFVGDELASIIFTSFICYP